MQRILSDQDPKNNTMLNAGFLMGTLVSASLPLPFQWSWSILDGRQGNLMAGEDLGIRD